METINIQKEVNSKSVYGRIKGKNIRESFLKKYQSGAKINLDFSGIETITHSFADELIGLFIYIDGLAALKSFSFSNCNPETQNMIKFVINDRLQQKTESTGVLTKSI